MANGFPWGDEAEGEHAFGVSARGENTHEPDSGGAPVRTQINPDTS